MCYRGKEQNAMKLDSKNVVGLSRLNKPCVFSLSPLCLYLTIQYLTSWNQWSKKSRERERENERESEIEGGATKSALDRDRDRVQDREIEHARGCRGLWQNGAHVCGLKLLVEISKLKHCVTLWPLVQGGVSSTRYNKIHDTHTRF